MGGRRVVSTVFGRDCRDLAVGWVTQLILLIIQLTGFFTPRLESANARDGVVWVM
ncbi:hypothetical protein OH77DRAFT_1424707 [Trametes cingulata]|nr:hypothetical protein OH77DRAFT_1424707 [Trametes cingulata]